MPRAHLAAEHHESGGDILTLDQTMQDFMGSFLLAQGRSVDQPLILALMANQYYKLAGLEALQALHDTLTSEAAARQLTSLLLPEHHPRKQRTIGLDNSVKSTPLPIEFEFERQFGAFRFAIADELREPGS